MMRNNGLGRKKGRILLSVEFHFKGNNVVGRGTPSRARNWALV